MSHMTDGLLRQRRNLFATSIVIIFLRFGGVQIEKVALLGTELSFDNIEALYAGIWVAFLYFLIRYYQYFRQEPNLKIAKEFWAEMNIRSSARLRVEAIKQHPASENYGGEFQFSELKKISAFIRQGTIVGRQDEYGSHALVSYSTDIRKYVPQLLLAGIHVVAHTSMITDYLLPFLVALFALLYGFTGCWEGSLWNVLHALF